MKTCSLASHEDVRRQIKIVMYQKRHKKEQFKQPHVLVCLRTKI